jgi:cystathionine gamma-synthase
VEPNCALGRNRLVGCPLVTALHCPLTANEAAHYEHCIFLGFGGKEMSDNRKIRITGSLTPERGGAAILGRGIPMRLETIAVRSGGEIDLTTGALAPPLHLSTTFEHGPASEAVHGFLYVRQKNPTQQRLEAALRDLEGGLAALVFSSGMAATAAMLQTLASGSHVIFSDDVYIDVYNVVRDFLPTWGIESSIENLQDLNALKGAIRPNTKLIWAVTPSNPLMKILDIEAISHIAHDAGTQLLVDNTFATPILQRPMSLGADVVLHSTTKYCGGHSDVQGGCLVVKVRELLDKLLHVREILGAVASPFTHAGHAIAQRQMKGFWGMLSFLVRGGREEALRVASRVKLFVNATSLGGVESLIQHRASNEGKGSRAPQNLLRISVGLEHPDDLIDDLLQALA